jgi:hypothetical protein
MGSGMVSTATPAGPPLTPSERDRHNAAMFAPLHAHDSGFSRAQTLHSHFEPHDGWGLRWSQRS